MNAKFANDLSGGRKTCARPPRVKPTVALWRKDLIEGRFESISWIGKLDYCFPQLTSQKPRSAPGRPAGAAGKRYRR